MSGSCKKFPRLRESHDVISSTLAHQALSHGLEEPMANFHTSDTGMTCINEEEITNGSYVLSIHYIH